MDSIVWITPDKVIFVVKIFFFFFFLILHHNIPCGYLLELPYCGDSNTLFCTKANLVGTRWNCGY